MVKPFRYSVVQLPLQEGLWSLLEKLDGSGVDLLLDSLEFAVSNGFFGLAAEISEQLRVRAGEILKAEPSHRVRLEIEQMKRLSYMGYKEPTVEAADRALAELQHSRKAIDPQSAGVWEFEAIGYKAWLEETPERLKGIISQSEAIASHYTDEDPFKAILLGFLQGERGRLFTLRKDRNGAIQAFEDGMSVLRAGEYWRSLAHLQVLYAEHLALLSDWDAAVQVAKGFLNEALGFGLRSHLLLRIVFLLLQAPNGLISEHLKRQLQFRCWILMHALGLSQSHTIFPLLSEALSSIEQAGWSLFEIDREAEVERWLRSLDHRQMERVLAAYYVCLGYEVSILPEHEPALDILALRRDGGGILHCVGVQVKHHQKRAIYKERIPDEDALQSLKARLRDRAPHCLPNSFHWHCTNGIHTDARNLLERRLRQGFGDSCDAYFTDLPKLVKILTQDPQYLKVVFSVEIEAGYPSLRDTADG